jgi:hypothetical protein
MLAESRTNSAPLAPPKPSEHTNVVSLSGRAESAVGETAVAPSIKVRAHNTLCLHLQALRYLSCMSLNKH